MARQSRGEVIDPDQVQIVHCIERCVRRAFLCGVDPYTGQSFQHRRRWIRERLEFLASCFAIDCLTFSIMSNHLHLVLRSRPDVVAVLADEEIARRWLRLFPVRRDDDGAPTEPSVAEIAAIVNNAQVLAERRRRLSDISWWMRCTAENIARRSNAEDDVSGHFWEGRFRAQLILDEASLLACAAYVDLNPIRAAMVQTLETSEFTGAKERIDDITCASEQDRKHVHDWERSRVPHNSGWMSPVEIDERDDPIGADVDSSHRRSSCKGFLSMSLSKYLELLDWTGRQLRDDKRGAIPAELAPILTRIGLDAPAWCDLVKRFGRLFKRAAGTSESLCEEAARRGQSWMQASGNPLAGPAPP
ncbi:hypothetical protein EC9_15450 [Rosistilla ulvae]|uniref:Transposase IS200-like domain-containing protein n=1 Tax=Rosistilla ulvae TaxID=1930277 RepID=A0A517LXM2_9BACT|nr:hypothetical protein [Rosistilla ulvae]QDS87367.1 hypothetical protein EC9_15450 [Rosistilla ulvae]